MNEDFKAFLFVFFLTLAIYSIGLFCGMIIQSRYQHNVERVLKEDRGYSAVPRLIGAGCAGSGGDIWAMDESDFPTNCVSIRPYY